jgi:hypothetical protein
MIASSTLNTLTLSSDSQINFTVPVGAEDRSRLW